VGGGTRVQQQQLEGDGLGREATKMKDAQSRGAGLHSAHACECIASGKKGPVWWLKTACVLCRARGGNASFMAAQHTTSSSSLCSESPAELHWNACAAAKSQARFSRPGRVWPKASCVGVGWGPCHTHPEPWQRGWGPEGAGGTRGGRMTQLATR